MIKSQLPLASILIDNYNYGQFLGEAIESALNQTYPNVEIIVVDDGSTDNSRELIASFGDKIIPVLKTNGGQSSALNAGFAACRGEWIHLLDSDDLFTENKVQRISELATECSIAGMIAHNHAYCAADCTPLDFAPPVIRQRALIDDRRLARRGKLSASLPAHSGLCIRRDVLQSISPLPSEIRMGIDNYLKWVIMSLYPVLLVPDVLAKQRIHGSNAGTILARTGGAEARVGLATQNATITFHMKKEQPHLKKLAWKQYGRILYGLRSCKSKEARAIEHSIRSRYSVVESSPSCAFYVAAAFTKAYVEDLLHKNILRA
jgi:glycosyltransferase involved in cell wall biosynthesis